MGIHLAGTRIAEGGSRKLMVGICRCPRMCRGRRSACICDPDKGQALEPRPAVGREARVPANDVEPMATETLELNVYVQRQEEHQEEHVPWQGIVPSGDLASSLDCGDQQFLCRNQD